MAATQIGTGLLTLGAPATAAAATILTVPVGTIVRSVRIGSGGAPITEDIMDADGAFHTKLVFENRMDTVQVVLIGKAYTKKAGETDGSGTAYYVDSVDVEHGQGALQTTVSLTKIKFT
jgi:hypothetical protein